jgi:gamma-glutamyltranspeptidase
MVEAALVTLREFGTKSFAEAVQPAIELADGFPIDELRVNVLRNCVRYLQGWPSSRNVFLPNGQLPQLNEIFRQPDLARTLRSMADVEKKALAAGASRAKAIDAVRAALANFRKRTAACCATKTWRHSTWNRRRRCRPRSTDTRFTNPASGPRVRR